MHGRWRGDYALTLTDVPAFRAAKLPWLDRTRIRSMVTLPRLTGALRMETTVDAQREAAKRQVLHTTRIASWGATLFRSEEVLQLQDDGRTATLTGRHWMLPAPWRAHAWDEARVDVSEDAQGATYSLQWLGVPMRQETRVTPEGLAVSQRTAWSLGKVLLRRVGA